MPGKIKMTSLLRSISDRFSTASDSPTKPRSDGFLTAKNPDHLFPRTTPEIDGEDCLHDCSTCTIKYPRKFSIDEDDKLYGEIKGWNRHLIVATGKTDWVRDVEDEPLSVMAAVGKSMGEVTGGRLMLSASDIPVPEDKSSEGPYGPDRPTRVLLLPAFQWIEGVTPNSVPDFIKAVISSAPINTQKPSTISAIPESETAEGTQSKITNLPPGLRLSSCPHKYLILLCSQATRDARCGQSAPLLRRELERHLRPLGLYRDLHDERPGGVGIYFISHVGGHKYSANMLVYRRGDAPKLEKIEGVGSEAIKDSVNGSGDGLAPQTSVEKKAEPHTEAAQCIWLARIRPEDCENVVRYTVLQGKVVKPQTQLRGGFDREKGVVSW